MGRSTGLPLRHLLRRVLARLLNRNLPASRRIELRSGWPLYFMPLLLFMQLLGPSPVWIALLVSLVTVYAVSYIWLRVQVPHIFFERRREGSMLVVGDALQERFLLRNDSQLPLHWLEFADGSRLPGYNPRQVVSCGPGSSYQWRAEAQCGQRGVFRLGPFVLRTGDPFGLFSLEMAYAESETILVFPRVALMPALDLPRGNLSGRDRRRKAYSGSERAPVVRAYRPGDSLRHVHWPSSARQGELIVTEVETEPSGDLWIVLDVNRRVQSGEASTSTLETGIVLAASAAAEYLGGGERRSVGLLTSPARRSGWEADALAGASPAFGLEGLAAEGGNGDIQEFGAGEPDSHLVAVPPMPGKGQVWRILAALAPVQAGDLSLDQMLHRSRGVFSAGQTVLVVTPDAGYDGADWAAELLHLRRGGVSSSVLAVTPPSGQGDLPATEFLEENGEVENQANSPLEPFPSQAEETGPLLSPAVLDESQSHLAEILTRYEIPVQFIAAGTALTPALTYRRRRTVLRTTPSGGVVAHEIEEDVG
ncbi:MAG: DUF58 domain-containing protein [Caldilineaceae bacterium]|nr:DUF58 domain-containing protein [Caldilineaceae bacterium]